MSCPHGKPDAWWRELPVAEVPQLADLAFFERPGVEWQVMMVAATEPVRVIGACPIIGRVAERTLAEYLALGWSLRGYRSVREYVRDDRAS